LSAETRQAARAGAQLIVWSETAAPTLEADKPALLQRVAALARAEGICIYATVGVPFEHNETFLFAPTGAELWHYQKNHPVPGLEPIAPVTNDPPVIDTPVGRLSNVICFDGDFPALTRVPADILLLPGWDWPEMGYTHTMKMARLRAIERLFVDPGGLRRHLRRLRPLWTRAGKARHASRREPHLDRRHAG
jgi:apolipoprotein N-acyltransferase